MLVGGRSLGTPPAGLDVVHGLEAEGLAVWAFDRATVPSVATVAEAVAGYGFEGCDAVVAIGGGVALDVAKAAALMVAQRSPYRALADRPGADGDPVVATGIPALLMVPATPAAALAVGAVAWIADETGAARPVRHPALRPAEAILAGDRIDAVPDDAFARSAAVAALIAADAGAAEVDIAGLLASGGDRVAAMERALRLSAVVEAAGGPRRRLALTAAVAGGADFAGTLAALTPTADRLDAARARLSGTGAAEATLDARTVRAAREACGPADAAELDRVLNGIGLDFNEAPRRRGRRGRTA